MISVIVPVYNTEKYLDQCIQSILTQTYADFELLLVDDGSTDSSGAICDKYAEQDFRVRVFHKANGGVSSARNMGLDNARGEWIGWVDSDDYIDADMYEQLYNAAILKNADIAYCNYRTASYSSNMPSDSLSKGEFINQYLYTPISSLWITLAKKVLYDNIRFNENANMGEDLLVTTKLYYYSISRVLVSKSMYFYRDTEGSLVKGLFDSKNLTQLLINNINLEQFIIKTEIFHQVKRSLAARILFSKQFYLYREKNISKWYSISPWTHKYIFKNPYNGIKGKLIEYIVDLLYRQCDKLINMKII